jgi:uncharacterized membrane protein
MKAVLFAQRYREAQEGVVIMRILSIVLRIIVGIVFLAQGVMKLTGVQNEWRDDLQVAPWFWALTGVIQLAGALGLLASLRFERLIVPSGLLFVFVMLGAIVQHVRIDDPVSHMLFPAVLLLLSAAIAAIGVRKTDESSVLSGGPHQSVETS